jgi:hypothetical protein
MPRVKLRLPSRAGEAHHVGPALRQVARARRAEHGNGRKQLLDDADVDGIVRDAEAGGSVDACQQFAGGPALQGMERLQIQLALRERRCRHRPGELRDVQVLHRDDTGEAWGRLSGVEVHGCRELSRVKTGGAQIQAQPAVAHGQLRIDIAQLQAADGQGFEAVAALDVHGLQHVYWQLRVCGGS